MCLLPPYGRLRSPVNRRAGWRRRRACPRGSPGCSCPQELRRWACPWGCRRWACPLGCRRWACQRPRGHLSKRFTTCPCSSKHFTTCPCSSKRSCGACWARRRGRAQSRPGSRARHRQSRSAPPKGLCRRVSCEPAVWCGRPSLERCEKL
eukprot:360226-Chlamydomonas_euryale.AAC.3